jgi:hypothetical protein
MVSPPELDPEEPELVDEPEPEDDDAAGLPVESFPDAVPDPW